MATSGAGLLPTPYLVVMALTLFRLFSFTIAAPAGSSPAHMSGTNGLPTTTGSESPMSPGQAKAGLIFARDLHSCFFFAFRGSMYPHGRRWTIISFFASGACRSRYSLLSSLKDVMAPGPLSFHLAYLCISCGIHRTLIAQYGSFGFLLPPPDHLARWEILIFYHRRINRQSCVRSSVGLIRTWQGYTVDVYSKHSQQIHNLT